MPIITMIMTNPHTRAGWWRREAWWWAINPLVESPTSSAPSSPIRSPTRQSTTSPTTTTTPPSSSTMIPGSNWGGHWLHVGRDRRSWLRLVMARFDPADDDFNEDSDVKSCPGVKSRAMDRCFCWVSTARGSNQVF